MKPKIKIISSWTRPGGGTVAHISLTNLLNDNGMDCTFYGPHDWHLDKCKGASIHEAVLTPDDIVISHFIHLPSIKLRKHILYCHEKELFPLKSMDLSKYTSIVFVSNLQKEWHNVDHPSVIIPPPVSKIPWKNPKNKVAGIIGSVDKNKQVHVSIERALKDGYEKVLLFGDVNDLPYFNESINDFVNSGKIILAGHEDNREVMYAQISEVYHSSLSETYGLVEAEFKISGITFNGSSNNQPILEEKEILEKWKTLLV